MCRYRSFPCPGRPLEESFPYSFQMVEHRNCGLVAEMSSSTEDATIWVGSVRSWKFAELVVVVGAEIYVRFPQLRLYKFGWK